MSQGYTSPREAEVLADLFRPHAVIISAVDNIIFTVQKTVTPAYAERERAHNSVQSMV